MAIAPTPKRNGQKRELGAMIAVLIIIVGFAFAVVLLYTMDADLTPLASNPYALPPIGH